MRLTRGWRGATTGIHGILNVVKRARMISSRFRLLLVLALMCANPRHGVAQRANASTKAEPAKIVFVCEHGTVNSVVALEHFNRLAQARGLDIVGLSRGTRPDSTVPAVVSRGLLLDGFDVSTFSARPPTKA